MWIGHEKECFANSENKVEIFPIVVNTLWDELTLLTNNL